MWTGGSAVGLRFVSACQRQNLVRLPFENDPRHAGQAVEGKLQVVEAARVDGFAEIADGLFVA